MLGVGATITSMTVMDCGAQNEDYSCFSGAAVGNTVPYSIALSGTGPAYMGAVDKAPRHARSFGVKLRCSGDEKRCRIPLIIHESYCGGTDRLINQVTCGSCV
jgi:hypothetical protein